MATYSHAKRHDHSVASGSGPDIRLGDNQQLSLGDAWDAVISYDGTNMLINPRAVGVGRIGIMNPLPLTDLDLIGGARFGDSIANYTDFATDGFQTMSGTAKPYTFEPYITDHDMDTMESPKDLSGLHVVFVNHATGWAQVEGNEIWLYCKWFTPSDCDISEDIDFVLEYSLSLEAFGWFTTWEWEWSETYECDTINVPPVSASGTTVDTATMPPAWHHETMGITRPPLFTIAGGTLTSRGRTIHIRFRRVAGAGDDYHDTVYVMGLRPMKRELSIGFQTPI